MTETWRLTSDMTADKCVQTLRDKYFAQFLLFIIILLNEISYDSYDSFDLFLYIAVLVVTQFLR